MTDIQQIIALWRIVCGQVQLRDSQDARLAADVQCAQVAGQLRHLRVYSPSERVRVAAETLLREMPEPFGDGTTYTDGEAYADLVRATAATQHVTVAQLEKALDDAQ
jgi:hypothetical protein